MSRVEGLVCFVTGSTGIAAATAERLAVEGARVFIASRTAEHCRHLAETIVEAGGRAAWIAAELTDEPSVEAAFDACVAAFGRVDAVFSAAGGSGRRYGDGRIHELTMEGWDRTIEQNLRSQALVARTAVRRMLAQDSGGHGRRGSLVLMSSVLASHPVPELFGTHAYAAAKGAITSLGISMAATYAADRIRVNVLAPGLTAT